MVASKAISLLLLATAGLAFIAQFFINFSSDNIGCSCLIFGSFLSIFLYINWTNALATHPLSTFSIFGFCVTTQLGAILTQSAAWTAVTASLRQPLVTFTTLAFYQIIAIAIHAVYRLFSSPKRSKSRLLRSLLDRAGLYTTPSISQLWLMAGVGCIALALHSGDGVLSRVSDAFNFLAWAPFLIPLYLLEDVDNYCSAKQAKLFLPLYAIVLAIFGIASNGRAVIFLGVVTIGLLYLLAAMRSQRTLKKATLIKLALLLPVVFILSRPLSDVATAMEIARGSRGRISPIEMIEKTIDLTQRPQVLEAYRQKVNESGVHETYDETYIANPMIARFVETKFHDNALYFAKTLTTEESRKDVREVTLKFFWSELPAPLVDLLGIDVDKSQLKFSMGDYLVYMSRGQRLGGYRTGSVFAQGQLLFGEMFPLFYGALCYVLFWLMDLLSIAEENGRVSISAAALMRIWSFFIYGITGESLYAIANSAIRGSLQTLSAYLLTLTMTEILTRPGKRRTHLGLRQRNPPVG